MRTYKSLDELKKYLCDEMAVADVRVTRFINVDNINVWTKLVAFLREISPTIINLSDLCSGADLAPNMNKLITTVDEAEETCLIIPLSEHLRLMKKDEIVLSELLKLEKFKEKNIRVYIPMYQSKAQLVNLGQSDMRFANNIWSVEIGDERQYNITVLNTQLANGWNDGKGLRGYKSYLKQWEINPHHSVTFSTKFAEHFSKNTLTDYVRILTKPTEFINYFLHGIELKDEWGSESQWLELIKRLYGYPSINEFLKKEFTLVKYDLNQLLSNWKTASDFQKWLIYLWSKIEINQSYYSKVIDDRSTTVDSLFEVITNKIFEINPHENRDAYQKAYSERKEYLKLMKHEYLPKKFWDSLADISTEDKLLYLTDCTKDECREIIRCIGQIGLNDGILKLTEHIYPVLFKYLQNYFFDDDKITEYFQQYKIHKVENSVTEDFISVVNNYAVQKGIWWNLKSRNHLVDDAYDHLSLIYWIDALGVEYLNLMEQILENDHPEIHSEIMVGYANLPTTTEHNKDFTNSRNVKEFRALDESKHSYTFEYPKYLVNEFELVAKALQEAIGFLNVYNKVIIASDHGASRLAVLHNGKTFKAKEDSKVEKHGRYCVDSINDFGKEIPYCIDKDDFHVFANYDRFSIPGAAKGELHGGASLEEVLVPVIILSKGNATDKQVTMTLLTKEIRLRAGQKSRVQFQLNKAYDTVHARVKDKQYICKFENETWYFEPDIGKEDKISVSLVSGGKKIGSVQVKVNKGISTKMDI